MKSSTWDHLRTAEKIFKINFPVFSIPQDVAGFNRMADLTILLVAVDDRESWGTLGIPHGHLQTHLSVSVNDAQGAHYHVTTS